MKIKYTNLAIMVRFVKSRNLLNQSIKSVVGGSTINREIRVYNPDKQIIVYSPPKKHTYNIK
jgi:hypothetical protein